MRIESIDLPVYCEIKVSFERGDKDGGISAHSKPFNHEAPGGIRRMGKAKLRSKSIAGIDYSADATSVQAVATAIAGLLAYPLVEVQKVDTDRVQ